MDGVFVLSAEGGDHLNKGLWTTHVILGCFPTLKEAIAFHKGRVDCDEEIVVLTRPDGTMHNVKDDLEILEIEGGDVPPANLQPLGWDGRPKPQYE